MNDLRGAVGVKSPEKNCLNIAVNARFLLPGQLEGFGWYTHEVVRRMVVQHPEDHFFLFFDRPFDRRFVYGPNVTPMVLFPPARHPLLFHWWFEWSVPRALKSCEASVFFSPDSMCSLRASAPTVMTCHDLVPLHQPEQVERRHRAYLLRRLPLWLQRADQVLTVSHFVHDDIAATVGIHSDKIRTIYNGCRDSFQPLDKSEQAKIRQEFSNGKPFFFYAGAIHPRKNIHRLIEAFDVFKRQSGADTQLLLAGRFAWKTGLVQDAWAAARYQRDIRFLGYVEENLLPALTASALSSVYISTSEGFGLPLVEAMACDTPVMTANASCLPEIAEDAALLVDPYDIGAIADGLLQLYQDTGLRKKLIERGRVRRGVFSWDRAARQVYDCLKETANK